MIHWATIRSLLLSPLDANALSLQVEEDATLALILNPRAPVLLMDEVPDYVQSVHFHSEHQAKGNQEIKIMVLGRNGSGRQSNKRYGGLAPILI